ncbi:MAG: hypothetical protein KA369_22000 [Spirochaetes bacterium]|nr:hypothetical protein [Spirochaetota bacterium]
MPDKHHPRPDMARDHWLSLDGTWEFEFGADGADSDKILLRETLGGSITVPYCIESEASGIGIKDPPPVSWYARSFRRLDLPPGKRFFLTFGAVDYEAMVWLNGAFLGSHRGGYTSFTFEITDHIADNNRLVVKVLDPRSRRTLRGKQYVWKKMSPIFYTPVSGIWQPVYIHATGNSSIEKIMISTNTDTISISWTIDHGARLVIEAAGPDGTATAGADIADPARDSAISLTIKEPRLWSVDNPSLYTVTVSLHDGDGISDRVVTFVGLRSIEAREGKIFLNGDPLCLKMLLVQGYYPAGHYTPVNGLEGYERDILLIKAMGFNGIRIHQKIEDPRFLNLCDRHGLLAWIEMPSPFLFSIVEEKQFENELWDVLDRDCSHPSVMAAVLFNETWGIADLLWSRGRKKYIRDLYRRVRERYPNLLVVDNSGYDHIMTDIVDIHHYLSDETKIRKLYESLGNPKKMTMRFFSIPRAIAYLVLTHRVARKPYLAGGTYRSFEPFMVSEFGGAGFYKTEKSILESFEDNLRIMKEYPAIAGYCLTQAYDVEGEQNGLLTFQRESKYGIEEIAEVNSLLQTNLPK